MGLPTLLPDTHNTLIDQVNKARFYQVRYGQHGKMHLETTKFPKPRIRTNLIRTGFEQGESTRKESIQIAAMEVELLLEFEPGVEANTEELEAALMDAGTIVVERREADEVHAGHETIYLRLQEGNYTHPPEVSAESGTFVRYLFNATPTRT